MPTPLRRLQTISLFVVFVLLYFEPIKICDTVDSNQIVWRTIICTSLGGPLYFVTYYGVYRYNAIFSLLILLSKFFGNYIHSLLSVFRLSSYNEFLKWAFVLDSWTFYKLFHIVLEWPNISVVLCHWLPLFKIISYYIVGVRFWNS